MKVSVIIPVYNVEPYLERCVRSVLQQDYKDLEIILVDDGSTDGSGVLCDQISTRDNRIIVIHQANQGLSTARNVGILHATGQYLVFLDSDDRWMLDNGLTTLLPKDDKTPDLIVFKNVHVWKDDVISNTKDYDLEILKRLSDTKAVFAYLVQTQQFRMSACFLLVRRQLLIENNIFFPVGLISEDIYWSMHLWQYVTTVSFVNLDFYGYFHRSDSLSTLASIKVYESYDKIFSYWKNECDNGCINKDIIRYYLADMWVNRGYNYIYLNEIDKPRALEILNKHCYLLKYAHNPKTKRSAWMVKHLGLKCTVIILGIYWHMRSVLMRHAI